MWSKWDLAVAADALMKVWFQEEVKEAGSSLSVHGHNVKVTEVLKDGDMLTFLIVSEKVKKVSSAIKMRSRMRVKQ